MDYALTTERLALCPVTAADHRALLAHWTLPDVRRFLFDGAVLSAAEVSEIIADSVRDFAAGGYGNWIIRVRGGTELAGTAGLRPLDDIGLEIFYSLAPAAWGRGYATEAARAVVGHALGTLGLAEVLAEVDEGNIASVAVVRRLGMIPFAVVPGALGPMTRYRTPAGRAGYGCPGRGPRPCPSGCADPAAAWGWPTSRLSRCRNSQGVRRTASPPGPDARPGGRLVRRAPG
jgi:RimJ/RimL family protein N-acetyltransferase